MNSDLKRLGIIGILCSVLLTGCANSTTEEPDTTLTSETGEIGTGYEDTKYLEPTFRTEDSKYWGVELAFSNFDAQISFQGENRNLSFAWAIAGEEVVIKTEELPEGVFLETIPGSVDKLLLLMGEGQAYIHEVYVYDLSDSTVTELMQGGISQYEAYDVQVSADLKHVVLKTEESDYYYDGEKIINLAEVCQQESVERVLGSLVGDKVLVSVNASDGSNRTLFYVYNPEKGICDFVVQLETKVNTENRDKGFQRYGDACATDFQENKLIVWNLMTGTSYKTALEYSEVKDILSVDKDTLLVITTDGKLNLVDKNSGENVLISENAVDLSNVKSWGVSIAADGTAYLNVQEEDHVYVYYKLK